MRCGICNKRIWFHWVQVFLQFRHVGCSICDNCYRKERKEYRNSIARTNRDVEEARGKAYAKEVAEELKRQGFVVKVKQDEK